MGWTDTYDWSADGAGDPGPMPTPDAPAAGYSDLPPPGSPNDNGRRRPGPPLHAVTIEDFAAVAEDGAGALLGTDDQALIAENSDVMIYGDGGAGKTTIAIDLAIHWAGGVGWLGIAVPRKVSSLLIENEGPRTMLRRKVKRKLDGTRTPLDGRVRIIDEPWSAFTFTDEEHRRQLADLIRVNETDVVIVGPLVVAGMEAHGTLGEVREFLQLLADVRRRSGRRACFLLIHHANRAGQVSGAWEGAVDTLMHCTSMGTGRTRLYVQKARWASTWHAHAFNLAWADNDGYCVEDKPELSDDDIAERILAAVRSSPGTGWTSLEKATPGIRGERRRTVRDRLLTAGELVNIGRSNGADVWLTTCPEKKVARLFLPDDPTIANLRPDRDADGTQSASATGEGTAAHLRPASRLKRDAVGTQLLHPRKLPLEATAEPCRICGTRLDVLLIAAGETTHPSCTDQEGPTA